MKEEIKLLLKSIMSGEPPDIKYIYLIDVGSRGYLEFLEKEIIEKFIYQGGATCRFYEGPYGAGKSHILQMIKHLGISKNMLVSQIELSDASSFKDWHLVTKYILENIEFHQGDRVIKGLPEILKAIGSHNASVSNKLRKRMFSHSGFANAMIKALEAKTLTVVQEDLLFQFLTGDRSVGAMRLRKAGIQGVKNPLTRKNSEQVLNTILSALYTIGFPVLILIDETEQAVGSNDSEKNKKAANIIRRLIDACSNETIVGSLLVITVLPQFISNCSRMYQAVGERLLIPSLNGRRSWRWPVLQLSEITSTPDQRSFLNDAVIKFEQLIKMAGGYGSHLKILLKTAGENVIQQNAGLSFRRDLIRRFASISLKNIN